MRKRKNAVAVIFRTVITYGNWKCRTTKVQDPEKTDQMSGLENARKWFGLPFNSLAVWSVIFWSCQSSARRPQCIVCLINACRETNLKVRQALVETAEMGEDGEKLSAFDGIVDSQLFLQYKPFIAVSHEGVFRYLLHAVSGFRYIRCFALQLAFESQPADCRRSWCGFLSPM